MDDEPISQDPADWLHNPHAGEMLSSEFLEPLGLADADIADLVGVEAGRITDVVAGRKPIDAELDMRLARYFGMSAGFFLGLQSAHDLLEVRRAMGSELDRIVPRAA